MMHGRLCDVLELAISVKPIILLSERLIRVKLNSTMPKESQAIWPWHMCLANPEHNPSSEPGPTSRSVTSGFGKL